MAQAMNFGFMGAVESVLQLLTARISQSGCPGEPINNDGTLLPNVQLF